MVFSKETYLRNTVDVTIFFVKRNVKANEEDLDGKEGKKNGNDRKRLVGKHRRRI